MILTLSPARAIVVNVSKSLMSIIVGLPSSSLYVKVPFVLATIVVTVSKALTTASKSIFVTRAFSSVYSSVFPSIFNAKKVKVSKFDTSITVVTPFSLVYVKVPSVLWIKVVIVSRFFTICVKSN